MNVNNSSSQSFQGVKYYNFSKTVVNTYFNYKIDGDGFLSKNRVAKILNQQKDNPNHIILDYRGNDDGKTVKEFAIVNGKEFVKRPFEKISSMLKRAAKYADSLRGKEVAEIPYSDRLDDFVLRQ